MVSELPSVEVVIEEREAGERLDKILACRELGWSRSVLQSWIEEGRVDVDGEVARNRTRPRAGAKVTIRPAPPPASQAVPQDIPLRILFEDDHVLVVDKPAGLVVHPGAGHADGTLVNAVLFHSDIADDSDLRRPGIVHRLDKDTSGIMVIAKTRVAREGLVDQFREHTIERRYQAMVIGAVPAQVTYDTLHGRHPVHRQKFTSKVKRGKRAVTHVRVVERLREASWIECTLETGRTHQIRVHLAEHGHPIVGDTLYGNAPRSPELRKIAEALGRQALHAGVLGFVHPITRDSLRFESELPADFQAALEAMRIKP